MRPWINRIVLAAASLALSAGVAHGVMRRVKQRAEARRDTLEAESAERRAWWAKRRRKRAWWRRKLRENNKG